MICPNCNSTFINFYLSSTEMINKYNSKGITGRELNKIFNPVNQKPYRIKCSHCKEILKEAEK